MRPHLTVEQRRLALRLKARGAQFQESSRRRCGRQNRSASVASGHCPASPSWRIATTAGRYTLSHQSVATQSGVMTRPSPRMSCSRGSGRSQAFRGSRSRG